MGWGVSGNVTEIPGFFIVAFIILVMVLISVEILEMKGNNTMIKKLHDNARDGKVLFGFYFAILSLPTMFLLFVVATAIINAIGEINPIVDAGIGLFIVYFSLWIASYATRKDLKLHREAQKKQGKGESVTLIYEPTHKQKQYRK